MADPGTVTTIAKFGQKNDAGFMLVDASDVDYGEGAEITLDTNGDFTQPQNSFWFPLDTFADAASDNIRQIVRDSKGPKLIIFHPASDGRTIVVEHDAAGGNVSCVGQSNITLDDIEDWCICIYDDTASRWYALGSGGGGAALTVQEEDGAPLDAAVTIIRVPNGGLVDNGAGDVTLGYALAGAAPTAHGIAAHTAHANWKLLYTDGSGDEQELALGAAGTVLTSAGASAAPTMSAPAGGVGAEALWWIDGIMGV